MIMKVTLMRKFRLYIEYALIALVIVVGVFGSWYYVEGLKLKGELATVSNWALDLREANEANQEALRVTQGVAEANSTILTEMATNLANVSERDRITDAKLTALEKSNEAVRAYLDARVPDGCLLDNTCDPNTGRSAKSP